MHGDEVRWRPTVLPWQVPFRTRCRPKNRAFLVNEPRYILSRLTIISGILMASFVPHEFYILERNIYYQICKFSITIFKKLIFSCFSPYMCGILETQERFPRTYFTHKTPYAYLSLFTDCWNIQENLDSDLFWAGRFFGGFPFCILAPRNQTCHFFDCTYELHFLRRIFCAPAQGCTNLTLISHERVDSRFFVLAGSESIFTEITEYKYFSLILTRVEFQYKSD